MPLTEPKKKPLPAPSKNMKIHKLNISASGRALAMGSSSRICGLITKTSTSTMGMMKAPSTQLDKYAGVRTSCLSSTLI